MNKKEWKEQEKDNNKEKKIIFLLPSLKNPAKCTINTIRTGAIS